MNYQDERYVRVYTRDTLTWKALGWEGQALLMQTLRKVDRAGILDLGGLGAKGLSLMTGMPLDVVERVLPLLLELQCVEIVNGALVVPKFLEAQESTKSPTARQAESRIRRRDMIRSGMDPNERGTVIYFIQSEHGGPIKIGQTEDMAKRLVGLQTSRPDKLIVLASAPGTIRDERDLHLRFSRIRDKGEWFHATEELTEFVKAVSIHGSISAAVTNRDASQNETGHKTSEVTPYRAVPSRTVLSRAVPKDMSTKTVDPLVSEVFGYWVTVMGSRAVASKDRLSAISARLGEGFTVDDLKAAIDGCARNPFNMGDNKSGAKYNDIKLICRDASKVEQYKSTTGKPPNTRAPVASESTDWTKVQTGEIDL